MYNTDSAISLDELEEEARENVTSPGSREELGASEDFFKQHTTIQKAFCLFCLVFLLVQKLSINTGLIGCTN